MEKGGVVVPVPETGGAPAPEDLASWGLYTGLAKGAVSGVARLAPLPARHPREDDDAEVVEAGLLAPCPEMVRMVKAGAAVGELLDRRGGLSIGVLGGRFSRGLGGRRGALAL